MDMERRLSQVERRCRVLAGLVAVLVAGLAFVLLGGLAAEPELQDLVGKSLKLQTEDGRIWLLARPLESGGQLQLLSAPVAPSLGPPPGIALYSEQGNWYVAIMTDEGSPEAQPQALVAVQKTHPRLWLAPAEGPPFIDMGETEGGSGFIGISDRERRHVWSAPPGLADSDHEDGSKEGD